MLAAARRTANEEVSPGELKRLLSGVDGIQPYAVAPRRATGSNDEAVAACESSYSQEDGLHDEPPRKDATHGQILLRALGGHDHGEATQRRDNSRGPGGALGAFSRSYARIVEFMHDEFELRRRLLADEISRRTKQAVPLAIASRLVPAVEAEVDGALKGVHASFKAAVDRFSEEHRDAHREEMHAQADMYKSKLHQSRKALNVSIQNKAMARSGEQGGIGKADGAVRGVRTRAHGEEPSAAEEDEDEDEDEVQAQLKARRALNLMSERCRFLEAELRRHAASGAVATKVLATELALVEAEQGDAKTSDQARVKDKDGVVWGSLDDNFAAVLQELAISRGEAEELKAKAVKATARAKAMEAKAEREASARRAAERRMLEAEAAAVPFAQAVALSAAGGGASSSGGGCSKPPRAPRPPLGINPSELDSTAAKIHARLKEVEEQQRQDLDALIAYKADDEAAREMLRQALTLHGQSSLAIGALPAQIGYLVDVHRHSKRRWESERSQLTDDLQRLCVLAGLTTREDDVNRYENPAEEASGEVDGASSDLNTLVQRLQAALGGTPTADEEDEASDLGGGARLAVLRAKLTRARQAHHAEAAEWVAIMQAAEADEVELRKSLEAAFKEVMRLEGALTTAKRQFAGERSALVHAALQSLQQLRSSFALYTIRKQHRQGAPPESVARGGSHTRMSLPIDHALDVAGFGDNLDELLTVRATSRAHLNEERSGAAGAMTKGAATRPTPPPKANLDDGDAKPYFTAATHAAIATRAAADARASTLCNQSAGSATAATPMTPRAGGASPPPPSEDSIEASPISRRANVPILTPRAPAPPPQPPSPRKPAVRPQASPRKRKPVKWHVVPTSMVLHHNASWRPVETHHDASSILATPAAGIASTIASTIAAGIAAGVPPGVPMTGLRDSALPALATLMKPGEIKPNFAPPQTKRVPQGGLLQLQPGGALDGHSNARRRRQII